MRSGSRCAGGTRYGIPARSILCLARTRRLAIVGSGMRNAFAISAVVRPASARSVSATRPSSGSAGWQQVKISRRRSSSISSASSNRSGIASSWVSDCGSASRPACWSSSAERAPRRSRSIARLPATVVNQAPGRCGIPSRGQRRSASANASCAQSSARSQFPVRLISVATTRPHSSRKAASTACWTAGAVIRSRTGGPRSRGGERSDAQPRAGSPAADPRS